MTLPKEPAGWTNRGYLPHCHSPGLVQAVTFRLGDSLPQSRRHEWEHLVQIAEHSDRVLQLERYLDQGAGACLLREAACAGIVCDALQHFHGQRYRLIAWCVMPNHVHVLFETFAGHSLAQVVHSWKTFTAREINRHTGHSGRLWQEDYFDTFMRDDEHQQAEVMYIERNPVNAGLVERAANWRWSSAFAGRGVG